MTIATRFSFFTIILVLFYFSSTGQVMGIVEPFANVGIKAGGSVQQLSSATVRSGPAPMIGVYVHKNLERFGVRLELQGSYMSYKTKFPASQYALYTPGMDTVKKGEFGALYLSVPLLIEYSVSRKLSVFAGPQFNYLASLTDKNGVFTQIYGEGNFIKSTDFSFAAGIELSIAKKLTFGARIIKGITDINNSIYYRTADSWTLTGMQLSVSYKIL